MGQGSRAGRGQQREPAGRRPAGRHARAPHRPQFLQSSRDDDRSRPGRGHADVGAGRAQGQGGIRRPDGRHPQLLPGQLLAESTSSRRWRASRTGVPNGAGDTYAQAFPGDGTTGPQTQPDIEGDRCSCRTSGVPATPITVNAGLRYDLQKFAQPAVRNPDAQLAAAGIDTSVLNTDNNNIGPRLGVAWAPVGRRYVVRAGYGLSSTAARRRSWSARRTRTTASTCRRSRSSDRRAIRCRPIRTGSRRFRPASRCRGRRFSRSIPTTRTPARSRRAPGSSGSGCRTPRVSVNYLFVKGDDLPRSTDLEHRPGDAGHLHRRRHGRDAATLPVRGRTFPQLHARDFVPEHGRIALQRHHGRVEPPLLAGISVPRGIYLREGRGHRAGRHRRGPGRRSDDRKFASNPADFDADRTAGNTDQRHRLVGSVIYTTDTFAARFGGLMEDVLKDWTLSAIYTVQSGQPYSRIRRYRYQSRFQPLQRHRARHHAQRVPFPGAGLVRPARRAEHRTRRDARADADLGGVQPPESRQLQRR